MLLMFEYVTHENTHTLKNIYYRYSADLRMVNGCELLKKLNMLNVYKTRLLLVRVQNGKVIETLSPGHVYSG